MSAHINCSNILFTHTLLILETFSYTICSAGVFGNMEKVSVKERDSVTLHTGLTQRHDLIQWTFGPMNPDSLVAEMNMKIHEITLNPDDIQVHLNELECREKVHFFL